MCGLAILDITCLGKQRHLMNKYALAIYSPLNSEEEERAKG